MNTVPASVVAGPPSLDTATERVVVTLVPGAAASGFGVNTAARSAAVTSEGEPVTT